MKKILLVSLVMLLAVSVAFSQFGIKGGLNIATFSGADKTIDLSSSSMFPGLPASFSSMLAGLPAIEPTARTGFVAGLSYKAGFIPIVGIQIEALYAQKGAVYEVAIPASGFFPGGSGKATLKLDYIDIPVSVKISPLPMPAVTPYIEGGVSYGILLSAKFKGEGGGSSTEEKIDSLFNKGDLSILVGVGVEIFIIDINARFVFGQSRIMKDIYNREIKVYNRSIMLTATIRF
jgi:hypothetical protein